MRKKLKQWSRIVTLKLLAPLLIIIGKPLARLILATCQCNIEGLEQFKEIAKRDRSILLLWHNRLIPGGFFFLRYLRDFKYLALVSKSRDGEVVSRMIESFPQGKALRVPHNARHEALRLLIRHMETHNDIIAITPDGPRGPRYQLKPGAAMAAITTGASVFPFNWEASRYWEFPGWDGLRFPKPFSTVNILIDTPVKFDKKTELKEAQDILQSRLDRFK